MGHQDSDKRTCILEIAPNSSRLVASACRLSVEAHFGSAPLSIPLQHLAGCARNFDNAVYSFSEGRPGEGMGLVAAALAGWSLFEKSLRLDPKSDIFKLKEALGAFLQWRFDIVLECLRELLAADPSVPKDQALGTLADLEQQLVAKPKKRRRQKQRHLPRSKT